MKTSEKALALIVVSMLIVWAGLSLQKKRTRPRISPEPVAVTKEAKVTDTTTLPQKPHEEIVFKTMSDEDALSKTWDLVCDPFVKLRTKKAGIKELSNLKLYGIIWTEKPPRLAVINDVNVTEGDMIYGFKVEEIQKDRVILNREGNKYTIELWTNKSDVKDNDR